MQGFTNTADRNETISYIEECGCQTEAAEADCVKTAMAFARQCHQGQTRLGRDGKVPYYDEHILGVYHILKDECHVYNVCSDADLVIREQPNIVQ